jgi:hypothetical protein
MSICDSSEDSDSTGILTVGDSPSKNTRSTSVDCGRKKKAPLQKAVAKGKGKTKSKIPAAAKKKIVGKICPKATSKVQVVKDPNFSAEEDNMLAKAYVNISTNPIHGSGMKANDFWDNVRQKWKELIKTEGTGVFISRTSSALKLHFQHRIQKEMNQWNACTRRVRNENQSGLNNIASIQKKTEALFELMRKKPF